MVNSAEIVAARRRERVDDTTDSQRNRDIAVAISFDRPGPSQAISSLRPMPRSGAMAILIRSDRVT